MKILDDNANITISTRLRELRTDRKLSYDKLHEELKKSGIQISIQALKDYEVNYVNHSKFSSTKGMKIETLYNLAQFYGVSVEWILGLSDYKHPLAIIREISTQTGLSEMVVSKLMLDRNNDQTSISDVINFFYEHGGLTHYSTAIFKYRTLYFEKSVLQKSLEALLQKKGIKETVDSDYICHNLFNDDKEIGGLCQSIDNKTNELDYLQFIIQREVLFALRIYEERLDKKINDFNLENNK